MQKKNNDNNLTPQFSTGNCGTGNLISVHVKQMFWLGELLPLKVKGSVLNIYATDGHSKSLSIKNVDIKYSAHDTFLESPSSRTLKNKIIESTMSLKSLGARKPNGLIKIANIGYGYQFIEYV